MTAYESFLVAYNEAAEIYMDDGHVPHNPTVRRDNGVWKLTSTIIPCDDEDSLECPYDDFYTYWWEGIHDPYYVPTEHDLQAFVAMLEQFKAEV